MRSRSIVLGVGLLAALSMPSAAAAAPSARSNAKVRVHVDTDLFGFGHYNPQDNDAADSNTNVVGFGLGRLSLVDHASPFALSRPVLALGIGAVILGGHAVIGGRGAFTVDGFLRDNDNNTVLSGRLVPYFNYMFNPRGRVQGFIGGRFGFGFSSSGSENDEGFNVRSSTIYPIVGAQGGLHVFLVDRISLDPGASLDYLAPHTRFAGDNVDDDFDKSADIVSFALTLGLSMWF